MPTTLWTFFTYHIALITFASSLTPLVPWLSPLVFLTLSPSLNTFAFLSSFLCPSPVSSFLWTFVTDALLDEHPRCFGFFVLKNCKPFSSQFDIASNLKLPLEFNDKTQVSSSVSLRSLADSKELVWWGPHLNSIVYLYEYNPGGIYLLNITSQECKDCVDIVLKAFEVVPECYTTSYGLKKCDGLIVGIQELVLISNCFCLKCVPVAFWCATWKYVCSSGPCRLCTKLLWGFCVFSG